MKFLVIKEYADSYFIEAEDFEDAAKQAYDDHTGYDCVNGIVKIPETTDHLWKP